jgi:putative endonuclease
MNISRHSLDDPVVRAAEYLTGAGFKVLDSKWRHDAAELAIIAADRGLLVVSDVKARTDRQYGTPPTAISEAETRRMRQLAVAWLHAHGTRSEQVRIDVITVIWEGPPVIHGSGSWRPFLCSSFRCCD